MKRLTRAVALLLMAVMVFAIAAQALAYNSGDSLVATVNVNVRTGPSTKYKILGMLKKGQEVTFQGTSGNWTKVLYNGNTGYVYTKYVTGKTTGGTGGNTGGDISGTTLYATANVNVRTGPSTAYSKLGVLLKNQSVTKVSVSGNWVRVIFNSNYGYIHAAYLTSTAPLPGTNNPNQGWTDKTIGYVSYPTYAYKYANSGLGTYETLGIGTLVQLTGITYGDFYEIRYGSGYAYVPKAYVSVDSTTGSYIKVIKDNSYAYRFLSSDGETGMQAAAIFKSGDYVNAVDTIGKYTRILLNGAHAYILTANLSKDIGTGSGTGIGGVTNNTVKNSTWIFKGPSTSYDVISYVAAGTNVYCTGAVVNGYAQVAVSGGYGYIDANLLTKTVTGGGSTGYYVTRRLVEGAFLYNDLNNLGGSFVAFAPRNVDVILVATFGDWAQISWNGVTYYTSTTNLLTVY